LIKQVAKGRKSVYKVPATSRPFESKLFGFRSSNFLS